MGEERNCQNQRSVREPQYTGVKLRRPFREEAGGEENPTCQVGFDDRMSGAVIVKLPVRARRTNASRPGGSHFNRNAALGVRLLLSRIGVQLLMLRLAFGFLRYAMYFFLMKSSAVAYHFRRAMYFFLMKSSSITLSSRCAMDFPLLKCAIGLRAAACRGRASARRPSFLPARCRRSQFH